MDENPLMENILRVVRRSDEPTDVLYNTPQHIMRIVKRNENLVKKKPPSTSGGIPFSTLFGHTFKF